MKKYLFSCGLILCFLSGIISCSSKSKSDTSYLEGGSDYVDDEWLDDDDSSIKIAYTEMNGNTITIPVKINGMPLDMIFDTGASITCITLAEAEYLYQKGNFSEDDIIDFQQFQIADGSLSIGLRINLQKVVIGDKITLYNVESVVVENQQAPLLLGQSVMKQFREISVDRENKVVKFFK